MCISEPFKVIRAWQLEEVWFLPRVAELDDVLSGDTISLDQRREKMGYGVTGGTYTRNLTGSGTEMLYPASNNAPVASSRCTQDRHIQFSRPWVPSQNQTSQATASIIDP